MKVRTYIYVFKLSAYGTIVDEWKVRKFVMKAKYYFSYNEYTYVGAFVRHL